MADDDFLEVISEMRAAVEGEDMTLADVHQTGVIDMVWTQLRDQLLGTDLASALAALEPVLPDELRAALRPPLVGGKDQSFSGLAEIAAWHDGQQPGTGALWGVGTDFCLMSSAEITAMEEETEAKPEEYPQWQQEVADDYYEQVMTDDTGGWLPHRDLGGCRDPAGRRRGRGLHAEPDRLVLGPRGCVRGSRPASGGAPQRHTDHPGRGAGGHPGIVDRATEQPGTRGQ